MPRVRRWFAAPLVVTLAGPAACSSSGGQRRSPIDDFAYVSRDGSACIYHVDMACPPNATCNPPPPQAVECPAGMGADVTGARVGRHGDGCVAVIPPCADLACAVPTPCPTPGAPLPALQWAVNPAGTFDDAGAGLGDRCLASPGPRTGFEGPGAPVSIVCPLPERTGFIERATPDAPCVACATPPCDPATAVAVACPDAAP